MCGDTATKLVTKKPPPARGDLSAIHLARTAHRSARYVDHHQALITTMNDVQIVHLEWDYASQKATQTVKGGS